MWSSYITQWLSGYIQYASKKRFQFGSVSVRSSPSFHCVLLSVPFCFRFVRSVLFTLCSVPFRFTTSTTTFTSGAFSTSAAVHFNTSSPCIVYSAISPFCYNFYSAAIRSFCYNFYCTFVLLQRCHPFVLLQLLQHCHVAAAAIFSGPFQFVLIQAACATLIFIG